MPDRYYLTTAIAYANNKPGVHTLYEVIGADAIARWHRMKGDDTRFLTGTDEHSVNIAMRAAEEGRTPKAFVDEKVALFKAAEDGSRDQPRPVHPDDRPGPRPGGPGDGPAGPRERRHLPRDVRGLVLPERGLPERDRRPGDGARHDLPEPPRRPAPVADREELVLPALGLPGAARAALPRRTPSSSSPTTAATRCSASSARASRTSRSAVPDRAGGSRSRSPRTARRRSARTARGTRRPARSTSGTTR